LLRFIKSVERYAESILPRHEAGERRRSSNINISRQQYLSPGNTSQSSGATRAASKGSSSSSPVAPRSPYPPGGFNDVVGAYQERSRNSPRSQGYANAADSRANFTTLPDLTELLGLVEQTTPRNQANQQGQASAATYSRKPQYSSICSTQSSHATRAGPESLSTPGFIGSEQVPSSPFGAQQEVLADYQSYAYDDVSSEDGTERMRRHDGGRSGHERSISPEDS
jgi:hypothetical protein